MNDGISNNHNLMSMTGQFYNTSKFEIIKSSFNKTNLNSGKLSKIRQITPSEIQISSSPYKKKKNSQHGSAKKFIMK